MTADGDDWEVPEAAQPQPGHYRYDLDHALKSIVRVGARIAPGAFTAESLGTERAGNGVLIREDGLILTIGYLVTEAEEIWLTSNSGRVVPGHILGYDQPTGFGLVQALGPLDIPVMAVGCSQQAVVGARVVIGGAGGRKHSVAAHVVARREFAGYWEYVLDEAIFTAPAHPNWGGTAVIGAEGDLIGIGSLQVPQQIHGSQVVPLNMVVPIDLLPPILDDLCRLGSADRPPRPWLGIYAAETQETVVIIGCSSRGPAQRAGLREGDIVLAVAGRPVETLAGFFRAMWALGLAGVDVPLTLDREGDVFDVRVTSSNRQHFLWPVRTH
jgi:S1-C subfamily serine protease